MTKVLGVLSFRDTKGVSVFRDLSFRDTVRSEFLGVLVFEF